MRNPTWLLLPGGLALCLAAWTGAAGAGATGLARCAERVRDDPDDDRSYRCYWVASRKIDRESALRALEALRFLDPENPHVLYYLAHIERDRGGTDEAAELYREAAIRFAERRITDREIWAWLSRFDGLRRRGRVAEAEESLENAERAAETVDDPVLRARVSIWRASLLIDRQDYGAAIRYLREAEEQAFPDGPEDLRRTILTNLARTEVKLGRWERALECYRRQAEIPSVQSSPSQRAENRYMMTALAASVAVRREGWSGEKRAEYLQSLREIIDLCVREGVPHTEARARRSLGLDLDGQEAIEQLERSIAIAEAVGDQVEARAGMRALAVRLAERQPGSREAAFEVMDRATEGARAEGRIYEVALGLLGRAGLFHQHRDRDLWIAGYTEALAAVEKVHEAQPESEIQARTLHRWAYAFHRFSGLLLEGLPESPDPLGDLDLAFRVEERLRARVLREEMQVTRIPAPQEPDDPNLLRRRQLHGEIGGLQRELADASLGEEARAEALARLSRLEAEDLSLRDLLARSAPETTATGEPRVLHLRQVQSSLGPDQAILTYQLSNGDDPPLIRTHNGGSWLLLITAERAEAFRLHDKPRIEKGVRMFLGLCRRGDGAEGGPGSALYQELLARALERAGPSVTRLVIVPDGGLHGLPFAALRPEEGAAPLGVTHEIIEVPSVALWLGLAAKGQEVRREPERALAALSLADPTILPAEEDGAVREADPWLEGLRLGSLPRARTEARKLLRLIGGNSLLRAGPDATESFIKHADLDRFGLIHVAAHAVVDYSRPERSAIILAPGATEEDGFLQPREIAELDLEGKVMILSACRSASGEIIRGEGALGLARAFFVAGARAVIGNLWPMRDEDAEAFVSELSKHLAAGESLAAAMRSSRRARLEAAAPSAAWAGIVLLGDGDFVPIPGSRSRSRWRLASLLLVASLALAILLGGVLARRRRAKRGRSSF